MVLLKNDPGTLPIQPGFGTIAVIGPQRTYGLQSTTGQPGINCTGMNNISCVANFATEIQIGDRGSSRVNPDPTKTIGPFAGLTRPVGTVTWTLMRDGVAPESLLLRTHIALSQRKSRSTARVPQRQIL